jgi:hypothetical protein
MTVYDLLLTFCPVILGAIFGFALCIGINDTYKHGQIDCINNVIKYELVKQEDGSTEWQEIKQNK